MNKLTKRQVDIIKGIGIISITAGHIFSEPVRGFLFLYHVPIFIFISGYLYKPYPVKTDYLVKKAYSLLVPYAIYMVVFSIPFIIKYLIDGDSTLLILDLLYNSILGGVYLTGWFSVFWFITCLFFTQQIFCWLEHLGDRKLQFIMVTALLISYANYLYFPDIKLPYALNTVFYTLPIFYVGHFIAKIKLEVKDRVVFLLFTLTLLFYSFCNNILLIDIKHSDYGVPVLSFVISFIMILTVFKFSIHIDEHKLLALFFSWLGTSSMTVMYLHQPIQISLKTMLGIKSEIILTAITISICLCVNELFKLNRFSKRFLLGTAK